MSGADATTMSKFLRNHSNSRDQTLGAASRVTFEIDVDQVVARSVGMTEILYVMIGCASMPESVPQDSYEPR